MAFFEFPHTRTYDSDLAWLIKAYKILNGKVNNIEQTIEDTINEALQGEELKQLITQMIAEALPLNVKYPPADSGLTPATGDGETDDTAALQAMIAYANANNMPMLFPAGVYRITGLNVNVDTVFQGFDATLMLAPVSASPLINLTADLASSGLTLNGNLAGQTTAQNVISIVNGSFAITNTTIMGGESCIEGTLVGDSMIGDSYLRNFQEYGIHAEGSGRFTASNVVVPSVASGGAMRFMRIDCDNCTVSNFASQADVQIGFEITGDNNAISANIPNAETPVNDGGQNNNWDIVGKSEQRFFSGSAYHDYRNLKENVEGDFTQTVGEFDGTATGHYAFNGEDIILNPTNPLTYKTPISLSSAFNYIPAKDSSGNTYKILTAATEHLPSSTVINASDFGVVGDEETDNANAFQNFFNFIVPNGFVGFIPNGTYYSSQTIGYRSEGKVILIGETRDGVIIKRATGGTTSALDFRNCDVLYIGNMTIDCNGTPTQNGGHGLNLVNVNKSSSVSGLVENLTVKNVAYSAIQAYCSSASPTDNIYNLTFRNLNLQGLGVGYNEDGVHPSGLIFENANACHIENSIANGFDHYSFEYKDFCRYCTIDNCIVENCGQGFFLGGDSDSLSNFYCRFIQFNNIIAVNSAHGLYTGTAQAITVNNYICYPGDNTVDEIQIANSQDILINNPILILQSGVTGLVINTGRRIALNNVDINDVASELNSSAFSATGDVRNLTIVVSATTKTELDDTGITGVGIYALAVLPLAKWYGTNTWT